MKLFSFLCAATATIALLMVDTASAQSVGGAVGVADDAGNNAEDVAQKLKITAAVSILLASRDLAGVGARHHRPLRHHRRISRRLPGPLEHQASGHRAVLPPDVRGNRPRRLHNAGGFQAEVPRHDGRLLLSHDAVGRPRRVWRIIKVRRE